MPDIFYLHDGVHGTIALAANNVQPFTGVVRKLCLQPDKLSADFFGVKRFFDDEYDAVADPVARGEFDRPAGASFFKLAQQTNRSSGPYSLSLGNCLITTGSPYVFICPSDVENIGLSYYIVKRARAAPGKAKAGQLIQPLIPRGRLGL